MAFSAWRRSRWCWIVGALLLVQGASHSALAQGSEKYIVLFRADTVPAARARVVRRAGAALTFNYRGVPAVAVAVPGAAALAVLESDPSVLAVVLDRRVSAYQDVVLRKPGGGGKPGSGGGSSGQVVPSGVARVGVPTAGSNGIGIGVAVVDTGIDLAHEDLIGTVDAFNAFGGSCQDDNGHGTHVAGIVAARDNSVDVIGVAPAAQLYCVKVLDNSGSGSDSTVMAGLDWVLGHAGQVQVVNMSLGRSGSVNDNPALHALVQSVEAAGIAIVVAAGNDAAVEISSQIPAAYPEVIAVASTTALTGSNQCRFLPAPIAVDTASYFTTDGQGVVVSAPGEDEEDVNRGCLIKSVGILSTRLGGGTTRMSGTSMAAPHVAGIAARYYEQGYAVTDIRQLLALDADRIGVAPLDSPTSSYTFDGVREGIAQAPSAP